MYETLIIIGEILAAIIAIVTIARFLFYTKSETDKKINNVKEEHNDSINEILIKFQKEHENENQQLIATREKIFEKLLDAERYSNKIQQEIYERLNQNKEVYEEYNKNMLQAISQIRQEDKDLSNNFLQLLNAVKDELKSDYISRYNDLLQLINTKVSVNDFTRLEQKFDQFTQTITELKTVVELQLKDKKKDK